jgi:hypothetical protein
MVVNFSSISMLIIAEEGTLTMPNEASGTHAPCVVTMFLGGMVCWHNVLGLETQNTSPLVHVSKCPSEWIRKGLERKGCLYECRSCLSEAIQSWEWMKIISGLCKHK